MVRFAAQNCEKLGKSWNLWNFSRKTWKKLKFLKLFENKEWKISKPNDSEKSQCRMMVKNLNEKSQSRMIVKNINEKSQSRMIVKNLFSKMKSEKSQSRMIGGAFSLPSESPRGAYPFRQVLELFHRHVSWVWVCSAQWCEPHASCWR